MLHSLFSQNKDMPVQWFEKFDKQAIKQAIIKHLEQDTSDTIEHCKEFDKSDIRRFAGNEIINFYEVHSGKVCKVITKGDKDYYLPIN